MPIELNEIVDQPKPTPAAKAAPVQWFSLRSKVSADDRRFFTEQLALMLETGANLHQALILLQEQNQQPAMAEVIGKMLEDVAGGRSFSAALSEHPEVFSTTYDNRQRKHAQENRIGKGGTHRIVQLLGFFFHA